jgi:hypothetical protein
MAYHFNYMKVEILKNNIDWNLSKSQVRPLSANRDFRGGAFDHHRKEEVAA